MMSLDAAESPEPVEEMKPDRCRVCLKDGDIPIFGSQMDISIDVSKFGGIEVFEDDNLPQHICDACHTLLEAAIMFRKTAQKSDIILMDTDFINDSVLEDEDPDYKQVLDNLLGTKSYLKREYIECDATSNFAFSDDCSAKEDTLSQDSDDQNIEMQLLKLKDENGETDPENEMIMIIVSDKNKSEESDQAAKIYCEQCNVTFKSSEELKKHNSEKHPKLLTHQKQCEVCLKVLSKKEYRIHLKEHRDKYKRNIDRKYGKVECHICSKRVSKPYFAQHVKLHGSDTEKAERMKECPICMKNFSVNYLSSHIQRVHPAGKRYKLEGKGEKLLQCPVCDRKIKESIFKDHVAGHGGSRKRYVCDQCGKVFKYPTPFKTHCLTHGGELKYQCQFCPYRGLHKALLKIHVRTHTGDYNYKCTECPARFITKSNLSRHLVRHNGTHKYFCDICNKGFYFKWHMDKHHLNVHSGKKDIVCEICGKSYGHRDTMLSHQLKVHGRQKLTDRKGRMPSYLKSDQKKDVDEELGN